jgi:hypothetical protein
MVFAFGRRDYVSQAHGGHVLWRAPSPSIVGPLRSVETHHQHKAEVLDSASLHLQFSTFKLSKKKCVTLIQYPLFLSSSLHFPPEMGPYDAEINDQRRIETVNRIAARLHPNRLVEPGFWACISLSNIEQLARFADQFDRHFAFSRLSIIENTSWTKTLRICEFTNKAARTETKSPS